MPYFATKIPNVCMLLDWDTLNNSLNCANIQISTELELKFLEQIHHLKFDEFLKGFHSAKKI
jgi:hypothetical protein